MLGRKAFRDRVCPVCGRLLKEKDYNEVKSPFFLDNHLPICKDCLSAECQSREGEFGETEEVWDFVNQICQWADVPFIPEKWTELYETNPNGALGRYLDYYHENPYKRTSWGEYEKKWRELIEQKKSTQLHPEFDKAHLKAMAEKFGNAYTTEELYRMDKFLNGLKKSFGITDVLQEDTALKMTKVSIEIDRAIDSGTDVSKLISSYNSLQKTGGFTSDNAKDFNNFESCSELFLFLAKHGWTKRFHNDETNDIVDTTLKAIQGWISRLYKNESTIADQVEDRLRAKAQIERMENMEVTDEDLDNWDKQIDKAEFEDEEEESFNPDIEGD